MLILTQILKDVISLKIELKIVFNWTLVAQKASCPGQHTKFCNCLINNLQTILWVWFLDKQQHWKYTTVMKKPKLSLPPTPPPLPHPFTHIFCMATPWPTCNAACWWWWWERAIFILRKGVLRLFRTTQPPT